jgi:hypothetical protein
MDIIVITKAIINTVVRLMPIGLYTGSAMNAVVMNDFRGVILFMGFIFNELISLGYRMFIKGAYNPHCALLMTNQGSPFVLPSPITQTVGFFFAFFMMDMYYQDQFLPLRFFVFLAIFILTIYSRINVGCKSLMDAMMCSIVGLLLGVGYYEIVKYYYRADYMDLASVDRNLDDFFEN